MKRIGILLCVFAVIITSYSNIVASYAFAGESFAEDQDNKEKTWVTVDLKGKLQFQYAKEDQIVYTDELLDQSELSDEDRAYVEEWLSNWDCLVSPIEGKCQIYVEIADSNEYGNSLSEILKSGDERLDKLYDFLNNSFGKGKPSRIKTIGDQPYLVYAKKPVKGAYNGVNYITIANGNLVNYYMGYELTNREAAFTFLENFIASVTYPISNQNDEFSKIKDYSFLDGLLTLRFSEDEYDVLTKENLINQEMLDRQGVTYEQADLYLSAIAYELVAVPMGTQLINTDIEIVLNIKEPEYEGIDNLKYLSDNLKHAMAQVLTAGFGTSDYSLYPKDNIEYIVFEAGNEVRYATIVDGRMIYLFVRCSGTSPTEKARQVLKEIVDNAFWNIAGANSSDKIFYGTWVDDYFNPTISLTIDNDKAVLDMSGKEYEFQWKLMDEKKLGDENENKSIIIIELEYYLEGQLAATGGYYLVADSMEWIKVYIDENEYQLFRAG